MRLLLKTLSLILLIILHNRAIASEENYILPNKIRIYDPIHKCFITYNSTNIPLQKFTEKKNMLPESFFHVTKKNLKKSASFVTTSPYAILSRTIIATCALIRTFNPILSNEEQSFESALRLYIFTDLVATTAAFTGSMFDGYVTWWDHNKKINHKL